MKWFFFRIFYYIILWFWKTNVFTLLFASLGNQTSNKNIKEMRKKAKKANKRSERKVNAVADVLENFSIDMSGGGGADYDFETDYNWIKMIYLSAMNGYFDFC